MYNLELSGDDQTMLFLMPFVTPIYGLIFYVLEGVFFKKIRFAEVKHPQWIWHIYPILVLFMIAIAFFTFIVGAAKSNT